MDFAFKKTNYIIVAIGVAIILLGYYLMAGQGSNETMFDADIFSPTRIKVAPIVCLIGFGTCVAGIMWPSKNKVKD